MSDYCSSCRFSPKAKEPERLCPFTPLYWAFLERNRARLSRNPRLFMPYRSLDSMAEGLRARHLAAAEAILSAL